MRSKSFATLFILFSFLFNYEIRSEDCFRAAVYEHFPVGKASEDQPSVVQNNNLDVYEEMASIAAKEGANILVFPEDGIINAGHYSRSQNAEIAERIPDPLKGKQIPCEDPSYESSVKTSRLSCLAKNNGIYIVADYGERVDCDIKSDDKCPKDSHYLFNTAVAFGPDGAVVGKYNKMQLFYEFHYNVPPKPDIVYFDTPFGRMGLFICFDMIYKNPGVELITKHGVQTMLFPTHWFDELPFRTAQQFQEGWALTNRVNLLASNVFIHQTGSVGSGIFSGETGQMVTSDIHNKRPHLLIADIPIDSRNGAAKCLQNRYNKTVPKPGFTAKVNDYRANFKLNVNDSAVLQLEASKDSQSVCNNGFCCRIQYSIDSENSFKKENYRLIVINRSGRPSDQNRYPYCEQICGVFRCDDQNCETISTNTKQIFKTLDISAKFTTNYTFPSVTTDGLRLVPKQNWIFTNGHDIGTETKLSLNDCNQSILSFNLYGRCYERDPIYRQ